MSSHKTLKPDVLNVSLQTTPVAIIGMASIFPQARTTQQYWDNILHKIDCVTDVPASRWSIEDYYDPNASTPDKTYCKRGGFIPDVEFDPVEFGLPPNILEVTDVSQLLSLVVAKEAIEDAGFSENHEFDHEHTGVILGVVGISSKLFTPLMSRLQYPVWEKALLSSGISHEDTNNIIGKIKKAYVNWEENSFPGTIVNVIAGRIANRMDLGGTNCVVDAACGSSLAAIKMALMELVERRANMMITGGVDTDNSIGTFLCFSKTPAFSKGEHVRTFDSGTDGMMVGEGLGMVVLKRLEDAERDGDRIYAVIKGVGSSSDGRFKSIYAPRPAGQAKALRRAYEEAGFSPSTVTLIEAHGTGTPAGDPAEVEALREVFTENGYDKQTIALGSVKSQIAHTKAAAGAASLMKVALALHHKVLPASINVTQPNSKLELENSPLYINTETRPWIRAASQPPRRAGVSSFGFGGTNYHLVLEEYKSEHSSSYRKSATPRAIVLNAANHAELVKLSQATRQELLSDGASARYAELAASSSSMIPQANARVGFLAENAEKAAAALKIAVEWLVDKSSAPSWEHPQGIYYRLSGLEPGAKLVALFPGQGSQYVNMGREAAVNFPNLREAFGAMDELFIKDNLAPLSGYVYPVPGFSVESEEKQTADLQRTEHAQPAIGTLSAGMYKILAQAGFEPDFLAGHSFGELTALWAAGVLDDAGYYQLAKARGKAMAPPSDPGFDAGGMLAVKGDIGKLISLLPGFPEITLANHNSNQQVVLAGSKPAIKEVAEKLNAQGFSTVSLPVSAAFHTSLVGHAQAPFAEEIKKVKFNKPQKPVYSNTTGKAYSNDPEEIRNILAGHILHSVLFKDEIEAIYAQGGNVFVEIGPKNVLTSLVKSILADRSHFALALNSNARKDSDLQLREAVLQLIVAGVSLPGFDPYAAAPNSTPVKKKSAATVILNGGYYTSPKTRQAFEDALKTGTPTQAHAPIQEPVLVSQPAGSNGNGHKVVPAPLASPRLEVRPAMDAQVSIPPKTDPTPVFPKVDMDISSSSMFYAHQKETLRIHEQYLQNQTEYARTFSTLMQTGFNLLGSQAAGASLETAARLLESVERSLSQFHEHQQETLRVHEQYLQSQSALARDLFRAAFNSPAAVEIAAPAQISSPVVTQQPAQVVSVEIPAAIPVVQPEPVHQVVSNQVLPVTIETIAVPTAPARLNPAELKHSLLEIVSEKTGYPVDMIDPAMDMEADLGIDSIKRVEILGAVQSKYPDLPKIPTDALGGLRTLEMILTHMEATLPGELPQTLPEAAARAANSPAPIEAGTAAAPEVGLNSQALTAALLEIVSEKTGYPQEMLDLNMDMEADLGIDSIKRVEILGAMQSKFPELPKIGADRLSELHTLSQISAALNTAGSVTASPF